MKLFSYSTLALFSSKTALAQFGPGFQINFHEALLEWADKPENTPVRGLIGKRIIERYSSFGPGDSPSDFIDEALASAVKGWELAKSAASGMERDDQVVYMAYAKWQQLVSEYGLLPGSVEEIRKFLAELAPKLGRNLTACTEPNPADCVTPPVLEPIWGYGCWCNFGENLMTGQGQPKNRHDEICKHLQECMRCARHDSEGCNPITDHYTATTTGSIIENNLAVVCDNAPNAGNACLINICTCEFQIINDMMEALFDSYVYQPEYKHGGPGVTFDPNSDCVMQGSYTGNGQTSATVGDTECCGAYPRREPYNSASKQCCDNTVSYNPLTHLCCSGGSVATTGDGC